MSFFLLAVNVLFYFFFLMEFQVELQFAMERQVREVTISQAEGLAGSLWIQGAVRGELQTEGRGISLGDRGIRFIRNQGGETEGEYLDITAVFQAGPPLKLFGSMEGTYIQRCRRRFWTGQDFVGESDTKEDSEETEYVYVTQSGTVYHRKRSCSYLKPSVRSSNYSALPDLRNKDGSKYRACERCTKNSGMQQTIYITDFGDRYHGSKNCSSLNRWIMKVSIEETGGKPPCSKCGR
ncbi:MAG: hypothetical protein HFI63_06150 [Lachnospiraceae bacterium]|nr:hypothetical protein [Lachnospiraceae bacterium]